MENKTVLITGAAGFIGSYLCDRFLAESYDVIGFDNFLSGTPRNIAHLIGKKNFHFYEYDVTNFLYIPQKISLVLHFACPASPVDYMAYPIETMKVDSLGTFNTLELARKNNARYVLASTSKVYGDPQEHPQLETYWGNVNPIGLRSVYDEAKRFSEALTMCYHRQYNLDIRIARIFNTYGPRMKPNDGRAVPNFISQALNDNAITVYGDGKQTRSFCYITDLVEAIYRLSSYDSLSGEVINIGNPEEYTMLELATLICKITSTQAKIEYKPLPPDDPKKRKPDISKAKGKLHWQPGIALEEGLLKTIEYFKNEMA